MTSPLFCCQSLSKSFGSKKLFHHLDFSIFQKERVGLIGPNGCGKTTLLKILAGKESQDSGEVAKKRGLKIAYVPQEPIFTDEKPEDILLKTLSDDIKTPEYEKKHRIRTWLSKLGFSLETIVANRLSGGWQKRLSLVDAFIQEPDILLLDEPTNHLDLEGIFFLEKLLQKEAPTYLLVSHDRYFLQNMVDRVIEINSIYPEGLFSVTGSYLNFLEKKEAFQLGQLQEERSIASKARRELAWLRESPKARTTKAQSRVKEAHEILDELSQIQKRNQEKKATIDFLASKRETKKLLTAKNLSKKAGDKPLFQNLDFTLSPGTRMGLMGPNGSGKTTLLRILAGENESDSGTIKTADQLQVVYFDQHRAKLPLDLTLRQALSPNGEYVTFRGQPIHVNGWCKRFLFSPDFLDMQLGRLSGGERARISIAHLMLQPADLLLLDEPTNDLDITTLETLEESLIDFPGAVVLITHDRYMLDRVANVFLALGDKENGTLYADYAQWEKNQKERRQEELSSEKKGPKAPNPPVAKSPKPKVKRSYSEEREYQQMEGKIQALEGKIQELTRALENPEIGGDSQQLTLLCEELHLAETRLEQLFLRWEELEHIGS